MRVQSSLLKVATSDELHQHSKPCRRESQKSFVLSGRTRVESFATCYLKKNTRRCSMSALSARYTSSSFPGYQNKRNKQCRLSAFQPVSLSAPHIKLGALPPGHLQRTSGILVVRSGTSMMRDYGLFFFSGPINAVQVYAFISFSRCFVQLACLGSDWKKETLHKYTRWDIHHCSTQIHLASFHFTSLGKTASRKKRDWNHVTAGCDLLH